MVYVIEEEVYSDSDKSSVYTSEDEFKVDKGIQEGFCKKFPLLNVAADQAKEQQDESEWGDGDTTELHGRSEKSKKSAISWPSYMRAIKIRDAKKKPTANMNRA